MIIFSPQLSSDNCFFSFLFDTHNELSFKFSPVWICKHAFSMHFAVHPFAHVGFTVYFLEFSVACDFVIYEVARVNAAINKGQAANAILSSIFEEAFILGTIFLFLYSFAFALVIDKCASELSSILFSVSSPSMCHAFKE